MANSYFSYSSKRFDTICQKVSYSYAMDFISSQARKTQVLRPKRWKSEQSVSISLIFPTPQDYMDFGDFLRGYFFSALSVNSYLPMRFVCGHIGADFNIIIKSDSLSVSLDTIAPTMNLDCMLVNNNAMERQMSVSYGVDTVSSLFSDVTLPDGDNYYRTRVIDLLNQQRLYIESDLPNAEPEPFTLDGKRYYLVVQSDGWCYFGGYQADFDWLLQQRLYTREWASGDGTVSAVYDFDLPSGEIYTWDGSFGYVYKEVL